MGTPSFHFRAGDSLDGRTLSRMGRSKARLWTTKKVEGMQTPFLRPPSLCSAEGWLGPTQQWPSQGHASCSFPRGRRTTYCHPRPATTLHPPNKESYFHESGKLFKIATEFKLSLPVHFVGLTQIQFYFMVLSCSVQNILRVCYEVMRYAGLSGAPLPPSLKVRLSSPPITLQSIPIMLRWDSALDLEVPS